MERVEVKSDFHQKKSKSSMNYNLQPFGWCSKMKPARAVESCASINLSSPMKQQYSTGSLNTHLGSLEVGTPCMVCGACH